MIIKEFRLKLYPHNFREVRSFYENTLGFKAIEEWDRGELEKGVMFEVGGTILELLSPKEGYAQPSGVDVSWEVSDVEFLWQKMKDMPNVVFKLRHNSWGDSSFCIADPEGFRITFFTRD